MMNGQNNEAHTLAQLQLLGHVETVIRDRVSAAISQHESEKAHVLSGYERDISNLKARDDELERLIRSACPGGDLAGHCGYHQGTIDDVIDRRKKISAALTNVFNAGVFATCLFVLSAVWDSIKHHLGK